MATDLPTECLHQIFNEMGGNIRVLVPCLLVNKHWCANTVPVLWRRPLRLLQEDESCGKFTAEQLTSRKASLIYAYYKCLPHTIKQSICVNEFAQSMLFERATFDYPRFLEELDCPVIQRLALSFVSKYLVSSSLGESLLILLQGIFELLFSRSQGIQRLIMPAHSSYSVTIPTICNSLRKLEQLSIDYRMPEESIALLAQNSREIQKLMIQGHKQVPKNKMKTETLMSFIESQRNLQVLELTGFFGENALNINQPLKSMTTLKCNCYPIPAELILQCPNIQTLFLPSDYKCYNHDIETQLLPLVDQSFPKLSKITCVVTNDSLSPLTVILSRIKAPLRCINIELPHFVYHGNLMPLANAISTHKERLHQIEFPITSTCMEPILYILRKCHQLVSVTIKCNDRGSATSELYEQVGRYGGKKIKEWIFDLRPESVPSASALDHFITRRKEFGQSFSIIVYKDWWDAAHFTILRRHGISQGKYMFSRFVFFATHKDMLSTNYSIYAISFKGTNGEKAVLSWNPFLWHQNE